MGKNRAFLVTVYPIAIIVTITIGIFALGLNDYYSLVRDGRLSQATVIEKNARNHGTVVAKYAVGNQDFTLVGKPEKSGKSFDLIEVGETVTVTYSTIRPSLAVIGSPAPYLYDGFFGIAISLLGISISFLIGLYKTRNT